MRLEDGKIETVSLIPHTTPGLVTATTLQSQYWPCDCPSPWTWAPSQMCHWEQTARAESQPKHLRGTVFVTKLVLISLSTLCGFALGQREKLQLWTRSPAEPSALELTVCVQKNRRGCYQKRQTPTQWPWGGPVSWDTVNSWRIDYFEKLP